MECAICFEAIGPARATLGCTHTFHINCIVSWYYQQNIGCDLEKHEYEAGRTASSCPCCRAAPASKLDDIPNEHLINFIPTDDDDSTSLGESSEGADEEADEELAAATPRTPRPLEAQPLPPVPPLDLSSLQLRWTRTGPTSWERVIEATEEGGAPPEAWDAARTPSPPPDSLVTRISEAARKIQAAWRSRASSPLEFV